MIMRIFVCRRQLPHFFDSRKLQLFCVDGIDAET